VARSQRQGASTAPSCAEINQLTDGFEPGGSEVRACAGAVPEVCLGQPRDLSSLDGAERLLVLAALTARFSAAYLRFMRSRAGEAHSYSNVRVLETLESGGPTIMREIAESLGMTARNMTAIVDALEEGGLVERTPHVHDRRATVVELTPDGHSEAARLKCEAAAWAADIFDGLTLDEQQQYADLLHRLAQLLCR